MADFIDVRLSATGTDQYNHAFNSAAETTEAFQKRAEAAQRTTAGFATVFSAVQKVIQTGMNVIASAAKNAVDQYDTMRNFPKIMEQMGFSAEDTTRNLDKMQTAIEALPTTIDEMVASARNIAFMTKDMDKATDIAIAMNNAFYASGASSSDASRGMNQFNQMLSAGKVDMQSWRTLLETMPLALDKVAESFGYAGASAKNDLYAALQSGDITFQQFADRIVELNEATGDFVGFAELAKTATGGLGTAMQNLGNAIVRGVADGLATVDEALKKNNLPTISEMVDKARAKITKAMTAINKGIGKVVEGFGKFVNFVKKNGKAIATIITGIATAIVGLKVAQKAQEWIIGLYVAFDDARKKVTAFFDGVKAGLAANPIGILIAAITGLVTALKLLRDGIYTVNPALKEALDKSKEMVEASRNLSTGYTELAADHKKELENLSTENSRVDKLLDRYNALTTVTFRTAQQKDELADVIAELNAIYPDLNIQYNRENDYLAEGNGLIRSKIKLTQQEKRLTAIEDQISESLEAQTEARNNLAAAQEAEREALRKLEVERQAAAGSGYINAFYEDAQKIYDEAVESVKNYTDVEAEATAELQTLYAQRRAAEKELTDAVLEDYAEQQAALNSALANNTLTMDMLTEENQQTADELRSIWLSYKEDATNMFSTLSDEVTLSVEQMQKNLDTNQQIINDWGDNMESLRTRFADLNLDQALLDQLADIGPEGAGYVKALANASNDELINLATTYTEGGEAATDALLKAFDIKDVNPSVISLVTRTEDSLRTKVQKTDWGDIGKDVDSGFAGGIDRYAYLVEQASMRIAGIPKNVIRAENAMHSPSKLMEKLGEYIGQGFAAGINATRSVVEAAADNIANIASRIEVPQFKSSTMRVQVAGAGGETWNIGGGTMFDELRDAIETIKNRPIVVQNDLQIDGRSFAKSTTQYISDEQQAQAAFDSFRKGERI